MGTNKVLMNLLEFDHRFNLIIGMQMHLDAAKDGKLTMQVDLFISMAPYTVYRICGHWACVLSECVKNGRKNGRKMILFFFMFHS